MKNRYACPHSPPFWCGLLFFLLLAGCAVSTAELERERHREAGLAIQSVYEAALPELSMSKQRHYAQRLYRITGEPRYREIAHAHGRRLVLQISDDIEGLADPSHAAARSRQIVEDYPQRTAKQRARKAMLAEWGEIPFARQLLFRLVQADYYGLLDTSAMDGHERALDYLAGVAWEQFLTDADVMGIYAAQVANQVHFLHQLGIADLREEVVAAFRRQYPDGSVAGLSEAEYHNKLYGMTHFVIASSRYYQRWVDPQDYAWILESFAEDIDRILASATEDIQAEVALSFLLAGREAHPAVGRIRDSLVAAVDPQAGIIPSTKGSTDVERGEHRNVLAIMTLRWPGRLYPGPDLSVMGL
ncbi:DUF3541 domain-containing protein [Billgrantia montanilacus]|uniref:DUF3541 domain-containing protein n=1 Tax=Billgrantia montanilacus TaxID=2282305 RepID=A0A368TR55_9GAMM|nr:DUF3541 domain-containing protein [Halomonas montanilacus]RCV87205.1 DUF3541 domain-containing protein [Halomonas montanilacus]